MKILEKQVYIIYHYLSRRIAWFREGKALLWWSALWTASSANITTTLSWRTTAAAKHNLQVFLRFKKIQQPFKHQHKPLAVKKTEIFTRSDCYFQSVQSYDLGIGSLLLIIPPLRTTLPKRLVSNLSNTFSASFAAIQNDSTAFQTSAQISLKKKRNLH